MFLFEKDSKEPFNTVKLFVPNFECFWKKWMFNLLILVIFLSKNMLSKNKQQFVLFI